MAEGGTGGSMKIYVKYKHGRVATLHVNPTDSILVIKKRASPLLNVISWENTPPKMGSGSDTLEIRHFSIGVQIAFVEQVRCAHILVGIQAEQQELFSATKETTFNKDNRTLGEYGIGTGDTLQCRVKEIGAI